MKKSLVMLMIMLLIYPFSLSYQQPENTQAALNEWENVSGQTLNATNGNISQNSGDSNNPSLVLDSAGNPCIAWSDNTTGNYEIYFARWDGFNWLNAQGIPKNSINCNVTKNSGYSTKPSLVLDSTDNPCIAWQDTSAGNVKIYFTKWDGFNWVNVLGEKIDTNKDFIGSFLSHTPSLELDSYNRPCIAWCCEINSWNREIFFTRWSGSSWINANNETLSATNGNVSNNLGNSNYPVLKIDSKDNPNIAWDDYTPGNWEVYFSRWNGQAWVNIYGKVLTNANAIYSIDHGNSGGATLALDFSDNPCIAWSNHPSGVGAVGLSEICYARWNGTLLVNATNNVVSTMNTLITSNNSPSAYSIDSYDPKLCLSLSGDPLLIWSDRYTSSIRKMCFAKLVDYSWVNANNLPLTEENRIISNNLGRSEFHSFILDSSFNPCVSWQVTTPGNKEIYFAKWHGAPQNDVENDVSFLLTKDVTLQNSNSSIYAENVNIDDVLTYRIIADIRIHDSNPSNPQSYKIMIQDIIPFGTVYAGNCQPNINVSNSNLKIKALESCKSDGFIDYGFKQGQPKINSKEGTIIRWVIDNVTSSTNYISFSYDVKVVSNELSIISTPEATISLVNKNDDNSYSISRTIESNSVYNRMSFSKNKSREIDLNSKIYQNQNKPGLEIISPSFGDRLPVKTKFRVRVRINNFLWNTLINSNINPFDEYYFEYNSNNNIWTKFPEPTKPYENDVYYRLRYIHGLSYVFIQNNPITSILSSRWNDYDSKLRIIKDLDDGILNPFFNFNNVPLFIDPRILDDKTDEKSLKIRLVYYNGVSKYYSNETEITVTRYPTLNYASWIDEEAGISDNKYPNRKPLILINGYSFFGTRAPTPFYEPPSWDDLLNKIKNHGKWDWNPFDNTNIKPLLYEYKPYIFHADTSGSWMWNYYWQNIGKTIPLDLMMMLLSCNMSQIIDMLIEGALNLVGEAFGEQLYSNSLKILGEDTSKIFLNKLIVNLGSKATEDTRKAIVEALGKFTVEEIVDVLKNVFIGDWLRNTIREKVVFDFKKKIVDDLKFKKLVASDGTWNWKDKSLELENLKRLYEPNSNSLEEIGNRLAIEIMLQTDKGSFPRLDKFRNMHITLIGHSMGGLVGRAFMNSTWPNTNVKCGENVNQLITIATPHRGTPLMNSFWGYLLEPDFNSFGISSNSKPIMNNKASIGLPKVSRLSEGLLWDNYDNNPLIFDKNLFLNSLNNNHNTLCPIDNRYTHKIKAYGASNGYKSKVDENNKGISNKIYKFADAIASSLFPVWKAISLTGKIFGAILWTITGRYMDVLFIPWSDAIIGMSNDDTGYTGDYRNNDGVLPLASALFDSSKVELLEKKPFNGIAKNYLNWLPFDIFLKYDHRSINTSLAWDVYDKIITDLTEPVILKIKNNENDCKLVEEFGDTIDVEALSPTNINMTYAFLSTVSIMTNKNNILEMPTLSIIDSEDGLSKNLKTYIPKKDTIYEWYRKNNPNWIDSSSKEKENRNKFSNMIYSSFRNNSGKYINLHLGLMVGDNSTYTTSNDFLINSINEPMISISLPAPELDLELKLNPYASHFSKNQIIVFNANISNTSWADSQDTNLFINLPHEFTFVSSQPAGVAKRNGFVINVGRLKYKTSVKITFYVRMKENQNPNNNDCFSFSGELSEGTKKWVSNTIICFRLSGETQPLNLDIKWVGVNTKTNEVQQNKEIFLQVNIDGGSQPYQITIDWGDGSEKSKASGVTSDKLPTLSHVYTKQGDFTIVISCLDEYGKQCRVTRTLQVK